MITGINNFKDVLVKEIFPKAKYNENCKKDKNYIVPYLLIYNPNSSKAVKNYLNGKKDGLIKKKISAVFKIENFEIDTLKIAIIMENHEFLEKYCEKYPHLIGNQDSGGNTPYHIAAMVINEKAIQILKRYDKSKAFKLKNKLDGTYEDILNMRKLEDPKEQMFYFWENGKIKKGDGNKYKDMTDGAILRTKEPYVSEEVAVKIWKEALCMEEEKKRQLLNQMKEGRRLYRQFQKEKSKVYIKKTEKVDNSLFAKKDIKRGEIITEFTAKILTREEGAEICKKSPPKLIEIFLKYPVLKEDCGIFNSFKKAFEDKKTSEINKILKEYGYLLGEVPMNGLSFRGMGNCANNGFPNAIISIGENIEGLPKRAFLFALNDIKKGEEIVYDYGAKTVLKRFGILKEIKLKELREFVLKIKQRYSRSKYFLSAAFENSLKNSNTREGESIMHKIKYIITTPHAVLNILNDVEIEDILECVALLENKIQSLQIGDIDIWKNLGRFKSFYSSLKELREKDLLKDLLKKAPTSSFWDLVIAAKEKVEGGTVRVG